MGELTQSEMLSGICHGHEGQRAERCLRQQGDDAFRFVTKAAFRAIVGEAGVSAVAWLCIVSNAASIRRGIVLPTPAPNSYQ